MATLKDRLIDATVEFAKSMSKATGAEEGTVEESERVVIEGLVFHLDFNEGGAKGGRDRVNVYATTPITDDPPGEIWHSADDFDPILTAEGSGPGWDVSTNQNFDDRVTTMQKEQQIARQRTQQRGIGPS